MPDDAPSIESGNVLLTIPQARVAKRACLFPEGSVPAEVVAEGELPNIVVEGATQEVLEAWYVACEHGCAGDDACDACPPDRGAVKARVRVGLRVGPETEDLVLDGVWLLKGTTVVGEEEAAEPSHTCLVHDCDAPATTGGPGEPYCEETWLASIRTPSSTCPTGGPGTRGGGAEHFRRRGEDVCDDAT